MFVQLLAGFEIDDQHAPVRLFELGTAFDLGEFGVQFRGREYAGKCDRQSQGTIRNSSSGSDHIRAFDQRSVTERKLAASKLWRELTTGRGWFTLR